jgi:hypothetical protein
VQEYPFEINWNATYSDPMQPLLVDIGSGTSSLFSSCGVFFFFFFLGHGSLSVVLVSVYFSCFRFYRAEKKTSVVPLKLN